MTEDECLGSEALYLGDYVPCEPNNPCPQPDPLTCPPDSIWSQLPDLFGDPNDPNTLPIVGPSEFDPQGFSVLRYENFFGLTSTICGVHWWGVTAEFGEGVFPCVEEDPTFEIVFYADSDGTPGELVWAYTVTADVEPTGIILGDFGELLRFSVDGLEPCSSISDGWVSIMGLGDVDCVFAWLSSRDGDGLSYVFSGEPFGEPFDLSLCLTTE
jgi:hypothetical protein